MQRVLGKIIRVVKMNYSLVVRFDYIIRQQKPSGYIRAGNARQIIPLSSNYPGVFV